VSKQSNAIGGTISIQNTKYKNKYDDDISERISNQSLPIKGLGGTMASATTLLEPRKVFDTNSTSG